MPYHRLLTRLYNTPLAIEASKLDVITSNVTIKLLSGEQPEKFNSLTERKQSSDKTVINVFDSLVSKNGAGDSGVTSYESITKQIQTAIASGSKELIFYIDSTGGEVSGLFGLANYIASLPEKYGVKTSAITDGVMTSAAYVIGSATQEVFATNTSTIGSIGVIATLINVTQADEKAGISYTMLRSKDEKALINPHEELNTKAVDDLRQKLSIIDNIMNTTINNNRPKLSLETIQNLNGRTILGEEAMQLGLIDGIVSSVDEIINKKQSLKTKGNNMATMEELLQENIKLQNEIQALKAANQTDILKATEGERTRCLGILKAAETLNLGMTQAVKRVTAGTDLQETLSMFEEFKAYEQQLKGIDVSGNDKGSANPTLDTQKPAAGESQEQYLASFMEQVAALADKKQRII